LRVGIPAKKEINSSGDLARQRNFDSAYVCAAALGSFIVINRQELVCANLDAFNFGIGKESVSNHFSDVDGSADGSAACFDADFFSASVEEGDASKDVVHDGLFADEHCVGGFRHGSASLLVYF
jgi:hypothetical protein